MSWVLLCAWATARVLIEASMIMLLGSTSVRTLVTQIPSVVTTLVLKLKPGFPSNVECQVCTHPAMDTLRVGRRRSSHQDGYNISGSLLVPATSFCQQWQLLHAPWFPDSPLRVGQISRHRKCFMDTFSATSTGLCLLGCSQRWVTLRCCRSSWYRRLPSVTLTLFGKRYLLSCI